MPGRAPGKWQADDTVVIYMTDHGRGLPREKRWCYDAGLHVPLIIRWPRALEPGAVVDDIVSWVDLAPTILSLAGIAIPPHLQGKIFLGPKKAEPPRQYHFAGRDRMDESYDCQRVSRSQRWHYIRNYFPEIPHARRNHYQEQAPAVTAMREAWAARKLAHPADVWFSPDRRSEELYNVETDPDCLENFASEPANKSAIEEHRSALDAHLETVGDWGAVPEQVMVDRGVVADCLAEVTARLGPLPARLAVESPQVSVQMPRSRPDAPRVSPAKDR